MTLGRDKNNTIEMLDSDFRLGELARSGWGATSQEYYRIGARRILNCTTTDNGAVVKRVGSYFNDELSKMPDSIINVDENRTLVVFDTTKANSTGILYDSRPQYTKLDIAFGNANPLTGDINNIKLTSYNNYKIYVQFNDIYSIDSRTLTLENVSQLGSETFNFQFLPNGNLLVVGGSYRVPIDEIYNALDIFNSPQLTLNGDTVEVTTNNTNNLFTINGQLDINTVDVLKVDGTSLKGADISIAGKQAGYQYFNYYTFTCPLGCTVEFTYATPQKALEVYNALNNYYRTKNSQLPPSLIKGFVNAHVSSNTIVFFDNGNITVTGGSNITTKAVKPLNSTFYNSRLWFTEPDTVYFSEVGDYSNFGTSFSNILTIPDMGSSKAMLHHAGLLYIGTETGVFLIREVNITGQPTVFNTTKISGLSIIKNGLIANVENVICVAEEGIYTLNVSIYNITNSDAGERTQLIDISTHCKHFFDERLVKAWTFKNIGIKEILVMRGDNSFIWFRKSSPSLISGTHFEFSKNKVSTITIDGIYKSYVSRINGKYVLCDIADYRPNIDNKEIHFKLTSNTLKGYNFLDGAVVKRTGVYGTGMFINDTKLQINTLTEMPQQMTFELVSTSLENATLYIRFSDNSAIYKFKTSNFDTDRDLIVEQHPLITTSLANVEVEILGIEVSFDESTIDTYIANHGDYVEATVSDGETFRTGLLKNFGKRVSGIFASIGFGYKADITLLNQTQTEYCKFSQAYVQVWNTPFLNLSTTSGRERMEAEIVNGDVSDNVFQIGTHCFNRYNTVNPILTFNFKSGVAGAINAVRFQYL